MCIHIHSGTVELQITKHTDTRVHIQTLVWNWTFSFGVCLNIGSKVGHSKVVPLHILKVSYNTNWFYNTLFMYTVYMNTYMYVQYIVPSKCICSEHHVAHEKCCWYIYTYISTWESAGVSHSPPTVLTYCCLRVFPRAILLLNSHMPVRKTVHRNQQKIIFEFMLENTLPL